MYVNEGVKDPLSANTKILATDNLTIDYMLVAPEVEADRLGRAAPGPKLTLPEDDAEEEDLHLKLRCLAIECCAARIRAS